MSGILTVNQALARDYMEPSVHKLSHIIVPKDLPVKLTLAGIKTIVHVGEFAIIPQGNVFEINSSVERYCLDFDFALIKNFPAYTILLPIISKPCVYHPRSNDRGLHAGHTNWYTNPVADDLPPSSDYSMPRPCITPISLGQMVVKLCETICTDELHLADAFSLAKLYELYTYLGEEIILKGFSNHQETAASATSLVKLSEAVQFITNNYMNELSLDDVSKHVGYSRTHLSKLFKEFYKFSFYDYLLDVRVAAAIKLLPDNNLSVSEIETASGFSSSSTFNRVFKLETGYSPRDFKKLLNN